MALVDKVKLIPREWKRDARGGLLKVMRGDEAALPTGFGEIYMVYVEPGQTRAGHVHKATSEWFTVLAGEAVLHLKDISSGETQDVVVAADDPHTVHVPAGIAHSFENRSSEKMILLAYADRAYDPADTVATPELLPKP